MANYLKKNLISLSFSLFPLYEYSMPLISNSNFQPSRAFKNGHFSTLYHNKLRKVADIPYTRIRLDTDDKDFIDLDYVNQGSSTLVMITHGLEGNAHSVYLRGIAHTLLEAKWDILAINLRSCSGEPNLRYDSYHAGKTDDLNRVVSYVLEHYNYQKILMVGFSLGGNLTLKYIGERGAQLPEPIKAAVAISVPCDLAASATHFNRFSNRVYRSYFLNMLKRKAREKIRQFPENIETLQAIKSIKTFMDFDTFYTAPVHGFQTAEAYWEQSSCAAYLGGITRPTLLINALDDPFLPQACYPLAVAENHKSFFLEVPKYGGHVGFIERWRHQPHLWHERRTVEFFQHILGTHQSPLVGRPKKSLYN